MTITKASPNDILRWPDGTTCYRSEWERGHYSYMSDDFEVITEESPEYASINGGDTTQERLAHTLSHVPMTDYFRGSLDTGEADAWVP